MKSKNLLTVSLLIVALAFVFQARGQMSDTCADGQTIVIDITNGRQKCSAANANNLVYRAKGINLNSANTDVGSFTNLPSRYIVRRVSTDNASASLTLATYSLRTATAGGGTAIVSAQVLSALTATTKFIDSTLAVTTDIQTASTLTIRNITAQGSAATADFTLEVTPLP